MMNLFIFEVSDNISSFLRSSADTPSGPGAFPFLSCFLASFTFSWVTSFVKLGAQEGWLSVVKASLKCSVSFSIGTSSFFRFRLKRIFLIASAACALSLAFIISFASFSRATLFRSPTLLFTHILSLFRCFLRFSVFDGSFVWDNFCWISVFLFFSTVNTWSTSWGLFRVFCLAQGHFSREGSLPLV